MRILVIDDNENNLASARQTLVEHEVITCSTYNDAVVGFGGSNLLGREINDLEFRRLYEAYKSKGMGSKEAVEKAQDETLLPYWDVVLCDYLMPIEDHFKEGRPLVEKPVGLILAMEAARNGAKFVAVVSNTDFHDNHNTPEAFMCQQLGSLSGGIITVGDTKMLVECSPSMVKIDGTDNKGKDYGKILRELLGEL